MVPRRKYINDYVLQELPDKKGKLRKVSVYKGPLYRFTGDGAKTARALSVPVLAATLCCVTPLVTVSPATRLMYVMVPLVLALLPLARLWICVYGAVRAGESVTRDKKDRISGSLAPWGMTLLVLAAVSLAGQAYNLIAAGFTRPDGVVAVTTAVAAGCGAYLFSRRNALEMEEIK
jgi:hypothetical protein